MTNMKVLIVGLGYAGKRYWRAFQYLNKKHEDIAVDFAYVSRSVKDVDIPYYADLKKALLSFKPGIVIVAVNDESHASVLKQLSGYTGFVIAEKPLLTQYDPLAESIDGLTNLKGFALDLVERYSSATRVLKDFLIKNECRLIRGHFYWGKDRINDYRPTCGVISEVIHALDLVSWIWPDNPPLEIRDVSGVNSDFSISGNTVMDSAFINASTGSAVITGYSSFVNIVRQRTVDFSFHDQCSRIIHARITYDTPAWDNDHLQVWTKDKFGREEILLDYKTNKDTIPKGLETIYKLSALCSDVLLFCNSGILPSQDFASLNDSINLQRSLNKIAEGFNKYPISQYICDGERIIQPKDADLEILG
ncbi:oxidoreductase [Pantoea ananatis BRT98]|nr:oxidoreductase [Pantoea ananatis BRT98]PWV88938.1 putative dehydrogenase [Pantoea ananatis]